MYKNILRVLRVRGREEGGEAVCTKDRLVILFSWLCKKSYRQQRRRLPQLD